MSRRPRSTHAAAQAPSFVVTESWARGAQRSVITNLQSDAVAVRSLRGKHPQFVPYLSTFCLFAPISDRARKGSVEVINDPSAIASISSVCDAAIVDMLLQYKSPKADNLDFAISAASWTAFENLWDKCGVPVEHWSTFKESAQEAGMTWGMLAQVAAAQILEAPSAESRQPAMLNESLGEQMRKMAIGANPNIRVRSSTDVSFTNPSGETAAAFVMLLMALCCGLATKGATFLVEALASDAAWATNAASSAVDVVGYVASKPSSWILLAAIINFINGVNNLPDRDDG